MILEDSIHRYWGKADPNYPGEPKWHPAILHMLDVAAVARAILDVPGPRRDLVLKAVEGAALPESWIDLMNALHDLGKIIPGFLAKALEWAAPLRRDGLPFTLTLDCPDHKPAGFVLLAELFRDLGGCPVAATLAQFPAAHHGLFFVGLNRKEVRKGCGGASWAEAREEVIEALRDLFGVEWGLFPWRDADALPTVPFITLAGLIAVADWLGSDHHRFPYRDAAGLKLRNYWQEQQARARQIVAALELHRPPAVPGISRFEGLFSFATPNPCQAAALQAVRAIPGPMLLIVETPMGSGKTEAALVAADIVLRERGATGLYYALPTQATANQMLGRVG